MKCNNLHRNVFCITSLSLQQILLIFLFAWDHFSLNTLWYNQLYHAPMFAGKKGSVNRHSTFNIIAKIRIWVCIPFRESQWVDCAWTGFWCRYAHCRATIIRIWADRRERKRELNWAESYGAQRCAWLPENWLDSKVFFLYKWRYSQVPLKSTIPVFMKRCNVMLNTSWNNLAYTAVAGRKGILVEWKFGVKTQKQITGPTTPSAIGSNHIMASIRL